MEVKLTTRRERGVELPAGYGMHDTRTPPRLLLPGSGIAPSPVRKSTDGNTTGLYSWATIFSQDVIDEYFALLHNLLFGRFGCVLQSLRTRRRDHRTFWRLLACLVLHCKGGPEAS